jgi:hypothetical protein
MKIATAVHALVITALLAPAACDGLPQDPPPQVRRHNDAPRPPTTVLATSLMPAMVPTTPEPAEQEPPTVTDPPPVEKRAQVGRRKHGRRFAKGRRRRGGDRETFRSASPE